ncbi:hypothetical protein H4S07_006391, partial [Coemansia furcata]
MSTNQNEIDELSPPQPPPPPIDAAESSNSFDSAILDANAGIIIEPQMSFGEPLHVSISRATTRFSTIQRAQSRQRPEVAEPEAVTGFDLKAWLRGRQTAEGPPFAKRFGLVFNSLDVYGANVSNKHISTLVTPFYKLIKSSYRGFGLIQLLSGAGNKRQLLHNISGEVKEGELLLVLGRPGSG